MEDFNLQKVIAAEKEQLRKRREKLGIKSADNEWFGIALSGGGIRSATINLGFLKTLNRFGILKKADYLSTVSGGGYTHSYIQGTLKETGSYDELFTAYHIDTMRQHGEYMIPGRGFWKTFNGFLVAVAFLVSWFMSLLSPFVFVVIAYLLYMSGAVLLGSRNPIPTLDPALRLEVYETGGIVILALLAVHFIVNVLLNFNLGISKLFNRIELVVTSAVMLFGVFVLLGSLDFGKDISPDIVPYYLLAAGGLIIFGFFANPNALSFHRYYRKQLADLFLRFSGQHENIPIMDLFNADSTETKDYIAPYPLINTCLNLQAPTGDDKFKGSKASDYFLLSPMYCGSKLTAYVPTKAYWDYKRMTLPAAVTISAAAVNPGLGIYSNRLLSALMTIFNFRLGFWISNPLILKTSYAIVWWPLYFFKELLGRIGTNNKMVNLSDGGHIENLGVYELLRRECRLIISVDAGEDKAYKFFDLNNLLIRARNELGYEIRFREGEQPEEVIFPKPSSVYSQKRFAVADILQHWVDEKKLDPKTGKETSHITNFDEPRKVGTFVYVKSSVTAPTGKPVLFEDKDPLRYGTYKYKIYHPDFPHESTGDQFFDPIQWEAYYQLGQFIAADVLGIDDPMKHVADLELRDLKALFDMGISPFDKPQAAAQQAAAPAAGRGMPQPASAPTAPAADVARPEKTSDGMDEGYRM
jgi:hypothetical protein